MVENKRQKCKTDGAHIGDHIVRVSGFFDIPVHPLKGEEGHFGKKSLCTPKVMCGRSG